VLIDLLTNRVLVIPIVAWVISQGLKVVFLLAQRKPLDMRYLVSGGMPSSHSAVVCALAATAALTQGLNSASFALATILALIVITDAVGVRRSVGQQSAVLNRIMQELRLRRPVTELGRDLMEFIGHTQFQVIIGGLLGIAVSWLWIWLETLF
jgi:acid phosphatase family membrane protein YuiD